MDLRNGLSLGVPTQIAEGGTWDPTPTSESSFNPPLRHTFNGARSESAMNSGIFPPTNPVGVFVQIKEDPKMHPSKRF